MTPRTNTLYKRGIFRASLAILLAAGALPLTQSTAASTKTWGNNGSDWNTAGDWTGGVPAAGDTAAFTGPEVTDPDLSAASYAASVTFDTTATGYDITSVGGYNLTLTTSITASNTSGTNTFDAALVLGAASGQQTISQAASGTLVLNSSISSTNTVGLNFSGAGTVTLAGSNSYTGVNTLANGTLNVNSATALGASTSTSASAPFLLVNSGTIDNTSGTAKTVTSTGLVQIGTTGFNFSTGSGTANNSLTFDGALGYAGPRSITLNGTGALTFAGGLVENNTATNAGYALTVNNGTGTTSATSLTLGGFVLSPSTGAAGKADSITGSANVTITGAVTDGNTSNPFGLSYAGTGILTISGNIQSGGLVSQTGANGTLTLSGDNSSASGGVTVSAGTLNVNSIHALGTGPVSLSGGTLDNTSGSLTNAGNNAITLNSFTFGGTNSLNLGTGTVSSAAGRTITLNGPGTLTFGGALTATTATGQTTIVTNGTGATSTSAVNFGSYVIATSNTGNVTGGFAGSGNVSVGVVANGTGGFAGSLSYAGTGTLSLTGTSSYTGATTVTNGTLNITGSNATSSLTTVGPSATGSTVAGSLISGNNTTATVSALTISSGTTVAGTLSPGGTGGTGVTTIGKLNVNGMLTLGTAGTATKALTVFELGGTMLGTSYDSISTTGAVTLTNVNATVSLTNGYTPTNGDKFFLVVNGSNTAVNGTFSSIDGQTASEGSTIAIGGYNFTLSYLDNRDLGSLADDISLTAMTAVPEPGTWVMAAVLLPLIGVRYGYRRLVE